MKIRHILLTIFISIAASLGTLWVYSRYVSQLPGPFQNGSQNLPINYVRLASNITDAHASSAPTDFEQAASIVIPTAVHIKTTIPPKEVTGPGDIFDPFNFFGGGQRYYIPGQMASGSGVIISDNGYIVTCNHVIAGASKIVVTLFNGKSYQAKVVGHDPNTDLAVLKIDARNLPYLVYGNSDNVKVGQWVLAAGYPLDLETTVTAGIVSATSREIDVNHQGSYPVDAYIQTDAAVNPGNSGGPLVNTDGQLIGILAAIASPTGSYAGYAYAIPVNIVKKVVNDILTYGTVQRAFLGVQLYRNDVSFTQASLSNRNPYGKGVVIAGVDPDGGAAAAGIKAGDVITAINGEPVNSESELIEKIAGFRPGDKINVSFIRDGKERNVVVTLRNREGGTGLVRNSALDKLGAEFITLSKNQANQLGISGGVMVGNIGEGLIKAQTNMREGFVITRINGYPVKSVNDLEKLVQNGGHHIQVEGIYPGVDGIFYYDIEDEE
ncbi:trypsin-like peptidase domain-containing protein [Thermoflavifilum thermophilum]|uniref:Do/DeqQ family serine protease n=1 Tax=Thermoflavifilum thermophilum TaxID=1393122 RepID=A0A1I7NEW9_9BACT|nr:trypsin-like peptidase domain-containing protein [Thermoflavifilum thermophilum]SFV33208.1 Do/DeqQ family serine protease [Thermoflavifilum thermophilum]